MERLSGLGCCRSPLFLSVAYCNFVFGTFDGNLQSVTGFCNMFGDLRNVGAVK